MTLASTRADGSSPTIDRRRFVTIAAACVAARPLAAVRAEARTVWRIGYLGGSSRAAPLVASLRDGLRDLGYVEGRNIALTMRWGEGDPNRLGTFARELVSLRMDVIVAGPDSSVQAAREATATIPIVMVLPTDPVRSGFVASLARPGGNVTGLTLDISTEIHGKRLALLKEAFPAVARVTVLGNPVFPGRAPYADAVRDAARTLGLAIRTVDVRDGRELESAVAMLRHERPQALFVVTDPLVYSRRDEIVALAAELKVPAVYGAVDWTEAGGLMAYGPSRADLMRRAATYVDRILKGARPAELPVEQPTRYELVVNLKTATALRLSLPVSMVARADRLIR